VKVPGDDGTYLALSHIMVDLTRKSGAWKGRLRDKWVERFGSRTPWYTYAQPCAYAKATAAIEKTMDVMLV
jgi:hypothetical protein